MTPTAGPGGSGAKRGRPKLDLDLDAVADAVADLFVKGGPDAVSMVDTAEKLNVSRATLYRTVSTKEGLLGVLFERSTRELLDNARRVVAENETSVAQLHGLVRLQVEAAIRMRQYMPVFFGDAILPGDVFSRWHKIMRDFENLWVDVVAASMNDGHLARAEPVVTTRLILGACIWISRWYKPSENIDPASVVDAAVKLFPAPDG